ncbi:MAG: biotin--[acetyl-CoA-carboxylase] ligase [Geodermatophilaceae bacterium]|nr:biotin--[acetyl-CoA-carboxylase] ligase [Geodermatophilaceae bacterium]
MPDPAELTAIRGPLDVALVQGELRRRTSGWPQPQILSTVESTNAEVIAAAHQGAAEGLIVVAEEQTSGRGRFDRSWTSPRGAGLTLSVLLRPAPPMATWGWLPIAAGVALLTVVRELSDVDVILKWPNDLLLGPDRGKAAGILAESDAGAVAIGIGLNVSTTTDELPTGGTSLLAHGALVSREALLVELVTSLEFWYTAWADAAGDAEGSGLRAAYIPCCATLGRAVTVHLPAGDVLRGTAEGIDFSGGLQVRTEDGVLTTVVAADVVHVRRPDD